MAAGKFRDLLASLGFQSYLWTQFLGAFNDNTYKQVTSLMAAALATSGSGALPLVGVIFMLPYFFFSGYAGQLADMYSKRSVQVYMKYFELFAMLCGIAAFASGRIEAALLVLFLMAIHSNFFSPAKYGIVPQIVANRDITRANSLLEMTTFGAIILGTGLGSMMFATWKHEPAWIGVILSVIGGAGVVTSWGIPKVAPSAPGQCFNWNPWSEIGIGLKHLRANRPLYQTVLAISYFWFIGALFQMIIILYGSRVLKVGDFQTGVLITFLAGGLGVGSILAGRLSGDKVELGLVPLGAIGMGTFMLSLAFTGNSYPASAAVMALLGTFAGIFIVPLNAYLQQRSGPEETGRMLAVNNFLNTVGIVIASGMFYLCNDLLGFRIETTILIFGLLTFGMTAYLLTVLPHFFIRFSFWMLMHTLYKVKIVNNESVPPRGGALLVSNHLSFIDPWLIACCIQRFPRFMMWRPYYEMKSVRWFFEMMGTIPVSNARRDIVGSLRQARKEIENGHVVCIFAEGSITRTGNLLSFRRGFEKIVEDLDVPVIPVHLDRLWGSVFSFSEGKFFFKWPKRIPLRVTVSFGDPLPAHATAAEVRQAVMELGASAWEHRATKHDVLPARFFANVRRNWFSLAMADSTGRELSYGQTAIAAALFARLVRKHAGDARMVGVLMPSSVGGALVNLGISLTAKIPVNLNFTIGPEAMESAIEQCGLRTIFTSKQFLEKAKQPERPGMVFVEDLLKEAGALAKAGAVLGALRRCLVPPKTARPEEMATVIFSSGSTGAPKGVMLSHWNVISNIEQMGHVFWITERDRLMGILPLFHSFGFTAGLWFPLVAGCAAVYHSSPVDAQKIGELVEKYKGTLLISTPTFYSTYIRKCAREQFASLRFAIVGAEKLRATIADAFKEKFGHHMFEGYGATEMSPVIAVNGPGYENGSEKQPGNKRGTVGHPLPGVATRVVDVDTGARLGPEQEGLLQVRGPNLMLGYLDQPERTAEVIRDGWYSTGDIVALDEDGFIRIVDRISRFSKIGGEMVPHMKVEAAIAEILGPDAECLVTALPDEQKGERLVALHTRPDLDPATIWNRLNEGPMPKVWVPKKENIHAVESIPKLGSGKVDVRQARQVALAAAAAGSARGPVLP